MGAHAAHLGAPSDARLSPRTRLLLGGVAAAFPDVDFIGFLIDPLRYLAYWHQGLTHSLLLLPLWSLLIGTAWVSLISAQKVTVRSCPESRLRAGLQTAHASASYRLSFCWSDRALRAPVVWSVSAIGTVFWKFVRANGLSGVAVIAQIGFGSNQPYEDSNRLPPPVNCHLVARLLQIKRSSVLTGMQARHRPESLVQVLSPMLGFRLSRRHPPVWKPRLPGASLRPPLALPTLRELVSVPPRCAAPRCAIPLPALPALLGLCYLGSLRSQPCYRSGARVAITRSMLA